MHYEAHLKTYTPFVTSSIIGTGKTLSELFESMAGNEKDNPHNPEVDESIYLICYPEGKTFEFSRYVKAAMNTKKIVHELINGKI